MTAAPQRGEALDCLNGAGGGGEGCWKVLVASSRQEIIEKLCEQRQTKGRSGRGSPHDVDLHKRGERCTDNPALSSLALPYPANLTMQHGLASKLSSTGSDTLFSID